MYVFALFWSRRGWSAGFLSTVRHNRCEHPGSQDRERIPSFQAVGECSVSPRCKNTWLKNPPGLPLVFPKTFLQEAPSVLNELGPVPEWDAGLVYCHCHLHYSNNGLSWLSSFLNLLTYPETAPHPSRGPNTPASPGLSCSAPWRMYSSVHRWDQMDSGDTPEDRTWHPVALKE